MVRGWRQVAAALTAGLLLAGCTEPPVEEPMPPEPPTTQTSAPPTELTPTPSPSPSPSATPTRISRDPVMGMVGLPTSIDPATADDDPSQMVVLNIYQRLMSAEPGGELKPDAATDCLFTQPDEMTCTLQEGLQFGNGMPITLEDVKRSIERAKRLGASQASRAVFASLDEVVIDGEELRFRLDRADRDFGFALASPAASIVPASYPDDEPLAPGGLPTGSGPFELVSQREGLWTLTRNPHYRGFTPAASPVVNLQFFSSSIELEQAVGTGEVDAAWHGIDARGRHRLGRLAYEQSGVSVVEGGTMMQLLRWDPDQPGYADADLRQAVDGALTEVRTQDSLLPWGDPNGTPSFSMGEAPARWEGEPRTVRLSWTDSPDLADLGHDVVTALEAAGITVTLVAPGEPADLTLLEYRSWTGESVDWLHPYLQAAPEESRAKLTEWEAIARGSSDADQRRAAIQAIQQQSAVDLVVIPLQQLPDQVQLGPGAALAETSFGPNWLPGLWGLTRS
ncbi:ABC transporter substrate-binding protein [Parenemella sanctibonifatiensis]|uniref:Solute-binding protein family 5 domain-containing protein n=1 Tax=Parenemella sanctibonifatiensis TaxID=2016505 RepID=A0A255E4I0_9ACTN|nr:ABC transporter substrate-binding protein [Parenemella sanctibonifatiensis]OYN86497.1 hypothetical protein CGZ92_09130 [Parenemella sanctibonifatiensis]